MQTNPAQSSSKAVPALMPTVTLPPEELAALQEQLKTIDNAVSLEELLAELDNELREAGAEL